ncbi:MAG: hypothetical protein ABIU95_10300 [Burkholderiales bacterium]
MAVASMTVCGLVLALTGPYRIALFVASNQTRTVGWGAAGGWIAAVVYVFLFGTTLACRWRPRAWQRIRIL